MPGVEPLGDQLVDAFSAVNALRPIWQDFVRQMRDRDVRVVFFTGSGGSFATVGSAAQLVADDARRVVGLHRSSSMLCRRPPAALGPDAAVVIASNSGITDESVEVMTLARDRGALVLPITNTPGSIFAEAGAVELGVGQAGIEAVVFATLQVGHAMIDSAMPGTSVMEKVFDRAPAAIAAALSEADREVLPRVASVIAASELTQVHFTPHNYGVAAGAGLTYLTEPHVLGDDADPAAIFGSWAVVDDAESHVTWVGEDPLRDLSVSAHRFAQAHVRHPLIIDSTVFDLPGIPELARPLLVPVLFAAASKRLAQHLVAVTGIRPALY